METPDPLIADWWESITKCKPAVLSERALVAADWACRRLAPMGLEARGRIDRGRRLRELPKVSDRSTALRAKELCQLLGATAAMNSADGAYVAAHALATGDKSAVIPYALAAIGSACFAGREAMSHNVSVEEVRRVMVMIVSEMLDGGKVPK